MVNFTWANCAFVLLTSITLPLYLLILTVIWWRPKLSLFHILMLSQMISRIPPVGFVMIHWFSPLLVTIPLLTSFNTTYTPEIKIKLPDNLMAVVNILSIISVMISFIICVFCYVPVLLFMLRNRKSVNRTRQNDVRLSIQVAGLLIAFLLVFIYNVGNYVMLYLIGVNQIVVLDVLQWWNMIYPLMNAFLCCVLPWTSLLLNHDIQIRLKAMGHCRKAEVINSSLFVSRASAEISQRFLR
ncbi:unnamed protein product [Cylicocyclus nassatus]|uniref:Uncharacterized protein n=1 Tax=Cylicocyclus nassatus TaxID=53992 RepID=A0AA36GW34_CYLNA|nr:unnamed protein product [Cylicocyclus nassatus]